MIGIIALSLVWAADPAERPWDQIDALIAYNRAGAHLMLAEWHCSTGRELTVRDQVERAIEQYASREQALLLRRAFDRELDRLGYANPYVSKTCNPEDLAISRRGLPGWRATIDNPALAHDPNHR